VRGLAAQRCRGVCADWRRGQVNAEGKIALAGSRYPFSGFVFPNFRPWVEKVVGINVEDAVSRPPARRPAPPVNNAAFLAGVGACCKRMSQEDKDRVFHGHGHTCQEVYLVRFAQLERVPDLVVWPGCHEHVEQIVALANQHNVVVIPFGGGTSVSGALTCPSNETRMIVSLDMHEMNKIKWIDTANMLVCMEAGIVGQDVKRRLEAQGLTIGHEPDSLEFSSLGLCLSACEPAWGGGWVGVRARAVRVNCPDGDTKPQPRTPAPQTRNPKPDNRKRGVDCDARLILLLVLILILILILIQS
jgi:alkyldihydroxyacetonephosphate synthase